MSRIGETLSVSLDRTNPGQFFACCGLLELAERRWGDATGWFQAGEFHIDTVGDLPRLIHSLTEVDLKQLDPEDNTASPIEIGAPFKPKLCLDWWRDELAGGKELKIWAGGTMLNVRIARAMQHALRDNRFRSSDLFDVGVVAYDPANPENKVEPFYFDARRCPNAHSRDVGFSLNDLKMTTTAFPAVELLCLIGLQRARPSRIDRTRLFDYHMWSLPLPPSMIPAAVVGHLPDPDRFSYRFENSYRTGQKKHKAFRSAIPISTGAET